MRESAVGLKRMFLLTKKLVVSLVTTSQVVKYGFLIPIIEGMHTYTQT